MQLSGTAHEFRISVYVAENKNFLLVPYDGLDGFHFGTGLGHRAADPELVIARSVRNDNK